MRRPPIIAILTAGACALGLAAPVAAQTPAPQTAAPSSANAAGLRYLSWPGRAYRPAVAPAPVAPLLAADEAAPVLAASPPPRPPIIPHGGQPSYAAASVPSVAPRQGLTPASAWIGSQAPAYVPQPAPMGAPSLAQPHPTPEVAPVAAPWSRARAVASASSAPMPAPMPAPATPSGYFGEAPPAAAPAPRPARAAAPTPRIAQAPAAATTPIPTPVVHAPAVEAPVAPPASTDAAAPDPMAPRRDAPIFRLQRPAAEPPAQPQVQPQVQAQTATQPAAAVETPPAQGGARYYSVHRQAGRQPDATPLPAPVYLDALPVNLTSMPASTDLAEPPAAPSLIRNANGRLQALPANEDPVLP